MIITHTRANEIIQDFIMVSTINVVIAYSSTGLVMALYVASMVSLCLPHLVEVRTFSMLIVLRALVAARSMCLL